MEVGTPTYNSGSSSYTFRLLHGTQVIEDKAFYDETMRDLPFPAIPSDSKVSTSFVEDFLSKTKKYFTNPLTSEKVLRHLRHTASNEIFSKKEGWYECRWEPYSFTIKPNDFLLTWHLVKCEETIASIPAEFTLSTTPRAQTPNVPEQTESQLRNIFIHDSLIPVGDLPLSDLPPLAFGTEEIDPEKEEVKRRIREARLKVQLAKLKAQRMEQKYYQRYGQPAEESDESSDYSTESEEEEVSFGIHSHS